MNNCKLIYTSNKNYIITCNIGKVGRIDFGEKVVYFIEEYERKNYSFHTSNIMSAQKKDNCLYIETLNSTYIFELLKDIEVPQYSISSDFYKDHQALMNIKSNKFLISDSDGVLSVVELEKKMTRDEAIDYFIDNKIPVDNVLNAVEN